MNYYKILGIKNDATEKDIKNAYKKLAIKFLLYYNTILNY